MPMHMCGGQRLTCGTQFSLSTISVLGIEFSLSGLGTKVFTYCSILPARHYRFWLKMVLYELSGYVKVCGTSHLKFEWDHFPCKDPGMHEVEASKALECLSLYPLTVGVCDLSLQTPSTLIFLPRKLSYKLK